MPPSAQCSSAQFSDASFAPLRYNLFNGNSSRFWGEAGTLASAASPKTNPNLIYAGGQNNGVSSGVIRTTDAGLHWERKSRGLWDTAVSAVWVLSLIHI